MHTPSFWCLLWVTLCVLWLQWSRGLGGPESRRTFPAPGLRIQPLPPEQCTRVVLGVQAATLCAALGQACPLPQGLPSHGRATGWRRPACRPSASQVEVLAHGEGEANTQCLHQPAWPASLLVSGMPLGPSALLPAPGGSALPQVTRPAPGA